MIRRTQHNINYANKSKLIILDSIITESKRVINLFINELWAGNKINSKFVNIKVDTWLSARMQQCLGKQALEIIKSQNKRNNKTKPVFNSSSINLDSRFVDVQFDNNSYDLWFKLSSIGNKISLKLPSKKHKHYNKFDSWRKLNSVRLRKEGNKYYIDMFHEYDVPKKSLGKSLGLDSGYKKLLSDSEGNHYGNNLLEIYNKLANKKRNSNKFKKLLIHKKNEINRVVNNLPLNDVRLLVIEQLKNVKHKSKLSTKLMNKMQHWSYAQVMRKLYLLSEIKGFEIVEVNAAYTSQTCSKCGNIDKSARNGEIYQCTTCDMIMDADSNAAINILHRGIYSSSTKEK